MSELLIHTATWLNFKYIYLQTQKAIYCVVSFIFQKTQNHRDRKQVSVCQVFGVEKLIIKGWHKGI